MVEHVWTVLCEKVLEDPDTRVISLVDILERLIIDPEGGMEQQIEKAREAGKKGVFVNVQMQVVSWWIRSDHEKEEISHARIAFVSPLGERVMVQDVQIHWEKEISGQRIFVKLDKLPIARLGLYWFKIGRAHV